MSIIAWIVVDRVAGWIAERIMGHNHGLLTILSSASSARFNLPSMVVATVGAVVLLAILGGFQNRGSLS